MNNSRHLFPKFLLSASVAIGNILCMEPLKTSDSKLNDALKEISTTNQETRAFTEVKNEINFTIASDKSGLILNNSKKNNILIKTKLKTHSISGNNKIENNSNQRLLEVLTSAKLDLLTKLKSTRIFQNSKLIDIKNIVRNLNKRETVLLNNSPETLKYGAFSKIDIPLKINLRKSGLNSFVFPKSVSGELNKITSFIMGNTKHKLSKYWRVHYSNYDWLAPSLYFTPLPKLLASKELFLSDKDLSLFMTCIKTDLQVNPYARGIDVPLNTCMLFDYFAKCNNYNSNAIKKIEAYQKYLSYKQNLTLTFQLLSVYLQKHLHGEYKNYITLLAVDALFNIDGNDIKKIFKEGYYNKHNKYPNIFQYLLRKQVSLSSEYNNDVRSFASSILNTYIIYNSFNNSHVTTVNQMLRTTAYIPILATLRFMKKKLKTAKIEKQKNDKISEIFIKCMNIGNYKLSRHELYNYKQSDKVCFPLHVLMYIDTYDIFNLYSVLKIPVTLFKKVGSIFDLKSQYQALV